MKILVVGSFFWEMYASAFYKAWKDMGHEVEKIDYEDYGFRRETLLATLTNRLQDRYHYGFFMRKYNRDIIDKVNSFKPDLVFLYRCYHIYGRTVADIRNNTIVFSYNNDDPFSGVPSHQYYRHYYNDATYCHLNYVYRSKNIYDFDHIGVDNCKILLPYFRKACNFPIDCKKDIPLAFMGHFENDGRDKYILKLKEAGLSVVVFGDDNWKRAPLYNKIKDVIFPAKRGKEYNEAINRTKVSLVFFSKLNHDTYTRRCFEIPITKGVMLSEYTDDMHALYPENECAVYFRNVNELVSQARCLLENEEKRRQMAQKAYDRVKELGGSEYDRCQQIIDEYQLIHNNEEKILFYLHSKL